MHGFDKLIGHVKTYGFEHRQLYAVSIMIFFFAIFDGIFSFITPIYIVQQGISESMMGIIIGTSSIAGLLFDFILCRVLKDTKYRLIYLVVFVICMIYPLVLYQAKSALIFIIAMALWGLYYDLVNIGNLDFITRTSKAKEYSSNFGVLRIFLDLGYLLAPLITGFLIIEIIDYKPFVAAWVFLILAFICYFVTIFIAQQSRQKNKADKQITSDGFLSEFKLWKKISHYIIPVLAVSFMLNIVDAIYWTIGPLLSESMSFLGDLGGLFMTAYVLPPLFVGWFVGSITSKYGKKRTAFMSLFLGSLFLMLFPVFDWPIALVVLSFLSSFCTSFASPAIAAAYADYIHETPQVEKEITTIQDSFVNIGYIIGPIMAGFSGQYLGHLTTFCLLGVLGIFVSLYLLKFTPKKINIKI